jgi:hypothetical protein
MSGRCVGGVCERSPASWPCASNADCTTGTCQGGICQRAGAGGACLYPTDCTTGTCQGGTCQQSPAYGMCASNADCSSGNCQSNVCCPSGQTLCNGVCVDALSYSAKCGGCGIVCPRNSVLGLFGICHGGLCI